MPSLVHAVGCRGWPCVHSPNNATCPHISPWPPEMGRGSDGQSGELGAFSQLTGIPPLRWMWNLWPHALPFPRPRGLSWQASVIVKLFTAACFMHSVEAQRKRM